MTTNASPHYPPPSTVADWRRRREEIAVALYRETIEDRDAAYALRDLVDDILAEMATVKS